MVQSGTEREPIEHQGAWWNISSDNVVVRWDERKKEWLSNYRGFGLGHSPPPGLIELANTLRFAQAIAEDAQIAFDEGRDFFQAPMPLSLTERSLNSTLTGAVETKTRDFSAQPQILEMIEAVGWRLEHFSCVFRETGAVSRDKLLSSGQVEQITGEIIGVYLFRRTD